MGEFFWAWMDTETALITNAGTGMGIAVVFTLVVLIVSTMNWVIAAYATLSIAGILACVMGIMKYCNWEFGIVVSIASVILIGFSVDYVVHLGNHYAECTIYPDRNNRMRESLKQIGISLFGASITTLLAGIPLYFCEMTFFTKFAILISATISFSLLFAFVFFSSLCHAFGPQHNFGNLKPVVKKLLRKCKCRNKNKNSSIND